ncbi:MAG: hypothetical protein ACREJM_02335 [Candidatus Saccharimonadales bacterium]
MRQVTTPNGIIEIDDETPTSEFTGFLVTAWEVGDVTCRATEVPEYDMAIAQLREWFTDFQVVRASLRGIKATGASSLLEHLRK